MAKNTPMYWILCNRSWRNLKASIAVKIGTKDPRTMAIETNPFVVAIPNRKFARKSDIPIKTKSLKSINLKFPKFLVTTAYTRATPTENTLMVVEVSSELVLDPWAIKVKAIPKQIIAPIPKKIGLVEEFFLNSGPEAQNAPPSAIAIPKIWTQLNESLSPIREWNFIPDWSTVL